MRTVRVGSLFSGYGGLEIGLADALRALDLADGVEVAWHCEFDAAPSAILAARFPSVPNLGDITLIDWATVDGGIEVLCGGFPCQDVSLAGRRAGMHSGTRSGLWAEFARAIAALRPRLVVIENVRGLLSARAGDPREVVDDETDRGVESEPWDVGAPGGDDRPLLRALGAVLGDLALLGYDAQWRGVRASDAGAPHSRFRIFIVARPADAGRGRLGAPVGDVREGQPDPDRVAAPDADGGRGGRWTPASGHGAGAWADSPADGADPRADGRPAPDADGGRSPELVRDGREPGLPVAREHGSDGTPTDADCGRHDRRAREPRREPERRDASAGNRESGSRGDAPADADRHEHERRGGSRPVGSSPRAGASEGPERERVRDALGDRGGAAIAWGEYEPAIRRWELILGRDVPAPTYQGARGRPRLSPRFSEWMMGLPEGWVDVPGLTVPDQLKALGNGVVPQQAALAVAALLADWR